MFTESGGCASGLSGVLPLCGWTRRQRILSGEAVRDSQGSHQGGPGQLQRHECSHESGLVRRRHLAHVSKGQ